MLTSPHRYTESNNLLTDIIKLQQNTLETDSEQIEMKNVLDRASEEHAKKVKQVRTLEFNCYEGIKW